MFWLTGLRGPPQPSQPFFPLADSFRLSEYPAEESEGKTRSTRESRGRGTNRAR